MSHVEETALIFKLPDEVFLSIFKHLTIDGLVTTARVCKRFRGIAFDDRLWTTIDLTTNPYSNAELFRFVRLFPCNNTTVLKLSGIPNNEGNFPPFTEQLMRAIRTSYPNLSYLHLSHYNFRTNKRTVKNITSFPSNLRGLYLRKCDMAFRSMYGSLAFFAIPRKKQISFDQLEILSIENAPYFYSEYIDYLPKFCTTLVELNLNGCWQLSHSTEFIETLYKYSTTLRRLYLSGTRIKDITVRLICSKLIYLNVLNIKECNRLTTNIVEDLLTLKYLEKLIANNDILLSYNQRT